MGLVVIIHDPEMRRLELLDAPKPHMPIGQLDSALEHSFHWKFAEWKAKSSRCCRRFRFKMQSCRSTSSLHKVQLLEIQVTLVARNILVRGFAARLFRACRVQQQHWNVGPGLRSGPKSRQRSGWHGLESIKRRSRQIRLRSSGNWPGDNVVYHISIT